LNSKSDNKDIWKAIIERFLEIDNEKGLVIFTHSVKGGNAHSFLKHDAIVFSEIADNYKNEINASFIQRSLRQLDADYIDVLQNQFGVSIRYGPPLNNREKIWYTFPSSMKRVHIDESDDNDDKNLDFEKEKFVRKTLADLQKERKSVYGNAYSARNLSNAKKRDRFQAIINKINAKKKDNEIKTKKAMLQLKVSQELSQKKYEEWLKDAKEELAKFERKAQQDEEYENNFKDYDTNLESQGMISPTISVEPPNTSERSPLRSPNRIHTAQVGGVMSESESESDSDTSGEKILSPEEKEEIIKRHLKHEKNKKRMRQSFEEPKKNARLSFNEVALDDFVTMSSQSES
jgi:hypothetical protein